MVRRPLRKFKAVKRWVEQRKATAVQVIIKEHQTSHALMIYNEELHKGELIVSSRRLQRSKMVSGLILDLSFSLMSISSAVRRSDIFTSLLCRHFRQKHLSESCNKDTEVPKQSLAFSWLCNEWQLLQEKKFVNVLQAFYNIFFKGE